MNGIAPSGIAQRTRLHELTFRWRGPRGDFHPGRARDVGNCPRGIEANPLTYGCTRDQSMISSGIVGSADTRAFTAAEISDGW
jgi:hypothetical protein